MSSSRVPGRFAPWMGAAICGAIGYHVAYHEMPFNPPTIRPWFTFGAVVMGFVAGWVLWFVEHQRRKKERPTHRAEQADPLAPPIRSGQESRIIRRLPADAGRYAMKTIAIIGLLVGGHPGLLVAADKTPVAAAADDERALIEAAFHLDVAMVRTLVRKGVNVNARYGNYQDENVFKDPWTLGWPLASNRWTPLIAVASSNKYPPPPRPIENTVEDLDWAREQIQEIPEKRLEELNEARVEIAKLLVGAGAALDADDGYGATALHNAVYDDFEDLALFLIIQGAKVDTKTEIYIDGTFNITPLHMATGSPNLVAALIHAGAPVNAQDSSGDTPLHKAARDENVASVKLLLDAGADPELQDSEGDTPIYWVGTSEQDSPAEHTIHRLLAARVNKAHNKSLDTNRLPAATRKPSDD